jgi:urea transport system substrate-binding protein
MKSASPLRWLLLALLTFHVSAARSAEDSIKVGILHSLSGTWRSAKLRSRDMVSDAGCGAKTGRAGCLGRKLEPVVVDPASDWNSFTDKAFELLGKEKVAVVFGCWTSATRKAVISGVRAT